MNTPIPNTDDLSSLSIRAYTGLLGSSEPSPGGGSAAALSAALGVSLAEMTSRINAKRTKSNPNCEQSAKNAERLSELRTQLLELVTLDAKAYEKVSLHWKNKSPELQDSLKEACEVPLEIARLCTEAIALTHAETGNTSDQLMSDLLEAGILLKSGFLSAQLNVEINLKTIQERTFKEKVRQTLSEGKKAILDAGSKLDKIMGSWANT